MPTKESTMIGPIKNGTVAASKWSRHFNSPIGSGLPENRRPYIGNFTARKQVGQLTSREIEVLQLVAEGKLNKQTASELCISIKTVEKHRNHLTKKLGIRGIAALTHFAIYTGIISCNPQLAMA